MLPPLLGSPVQNSNTDAELKLRRERTEHMRHRRRSKWHCRRVVETAHTKALLLARGNIIVITICEAASIPNSEVEKKKFWIII